ncbi:UNVERIFIED_CONTAM: hypothetical protein B566_EDAN018763, partial [Ephemera danica]
MVQVEYTHTHQMRMMATNPTLLRVYATLTIVVEILVNFLKFLYYIGESAYHMAVPVPEKSVKDELVLITGAGHGIGRELALQFSTLGARLALWDLDLGRCEQTAKEVRSLGGQAQAFCCDVSNRQQVLEVAEQTRQKMGAVNILVNNAGIMVCKTMANHTENDIRKEFGVNVLAHFWMFEAFLPDMKAQGRGHIVALSSMAGVLGLKNLVPYCSSKFAVRGLMEALSEELRQESKKTDIKFTTIYPYIVNTGMVHKPHIRFPKVLGVVSPREAASCIISAMRRNIRETSIPSHLFPMNNFV